MDRVNQFAVYALGQTLHGLRLIGPIDASDLYAPLTRCRVALARLLKGDPVPVGISAGKAKALQDDLEGYWNYYFYEHDSQGSPVLNESGKPKFKFPDRGVQP